MSSDCEYVTDPDGFEVGNVYVKTMEDLRAKDKKVYFMAINKKTLVTYRDGHFGKFTTKKQGHSSIGISVSELCNKWRIQLEELDDYMLTYFQPDEDARIRARRQKYE